MRGIAVALSGRGHHAAVVGRPALLHSLVDTAEHLSVKPSASVSRGCHLNGGVAGGVGCANAPGFAHGRA